MRTPFLILLCACLFACQPQSEQSANTSTEDLTSYVNPFVGTSKMGHTFPGATLPFGMVQLSPQTNFIPMFHADGSYRKQTYAYCAGYQYKDSTIIGFTHTQFSGTGHSDLGDILIMPTQGELQLSGHQDSIYKEVEVSSFSHQNEAAGPGYYSVLLDKHKIQAELTSSERVGFHKYTFSKEEDAHIILDMVYNVYHHDNKNVWTFIRIENDSTITGYRQTKGWARTRTQYFTLQFSKPFASYGHVKYDKESYNGFYRRFDEGRNFPEMAGKNIRAYFDFDIEAGEEILVKCALSNVSTKGATNNLAHEIPHWDFDLVKDNARKKWNKELNKIKVQTLSEEDKVTFYTALYHSCLSPSIYQDVDGQYRGLDQNIHQATSFTNYTTFSLWDTYRALHPLFNLIQPQRNNDMIKSMLAHYEQSVHHMLPIWSHHANENWCMIGYHATSVIADAMVKKVGDFNHQKALEASISTAHVSYFDGLDFYLQNGYFADDLTHSSVSKTLEIAYNDWCIAQMARQNGDEENEHIFNKRALNYLNTFDSTSSYMRPRLSNGAFRAAFDPMDTHGQGFIEGNAWNYGLYVPHDIDRMISMMGGKEAFSLKLDSLFTLAIEDRYIEHHEDITRDGIIGNYVHGNEPGHHIPYLYMYCDDASKTQERVRMIMRSMYGPGVEGLCGNDDAGQMSAWYIFSSLGMYPVTPGSPDYVLGSPLVKEAILDLPNGKALHIKALNQAEMNVFVKSVKLNGVEQSQTINHHDLMKGGELIFEMSDVAN